MTEKYAFFEPIDNLTVPMLSTLCLQSRDQVSSSAFDIQKNKSSKSIASSGPPCYKNRTASEVKHFLLNWCRAKTKDYSNINITNFSKSWSDGMAFCALLHHFFPDAFEFSSLNPENSRENFSLAFSIAEQRANVYPLLDVEDMINLKNNPDWKSIFVYLSSIYNSLKNKE